MHKSILFLESAGAGSSAYRAVIKTRHGRTLYLSLELSGEVCSVVECFLHRPGPGAPKTAPGAQKLQTHRFPADKLLEVIASQLDKTFYGVEYVQNDTAGFTPGGVPPT